ARFREIPGDGLLAFTAYAEAPEDRGTVAYLQDCAVQAGRETCFADLPDIGLRADGRLCTRDEAPVDTLFKLYPWEWAFRDAFGSAAGRTPTRFLEPPWKALLSNKGLLPCLWALAPGHPNLLPAFFEDDPACAQLADTYVRKPLFSREGANIRIVRDGAVLADDDGPYGAEGHIRQGLAELPVFEGRRALVGSWMVGDAPAGLCIREAPGLVTGNAALFVPHFIEAA
ncbi:glutathionylspermidine synthase family protein, partial [Methylobacterium trifolii]|uniref:glutathionylspermidine synthase family protein n=1 Tax=Methylobacterium trifolii TaxID=1003092 RepID=UPI001EDFADA1